MLNRLITCMDFHELSKSTSNISEQLVSKINSKINERKEKTSILISTERKRLTSSYIKFIQRISPIRLANKETDKVLIIYNLLIVYTLR